MQRLQAVMKNGLVAVDRFEGSFAVCEQEDGSMVDVDMKLLPEGTKEGDVLTFHNGIYAVDAEVTAARAKRIRQLTGELWEK
jgi:hypothetical protein